MVIILPDSNDPIYLSTITYYRNGKQSSKFQLRSNGIRRKS
jgi:hypothetical protein